MFSKSCLETIIILNRHLQDCVSQITSHTSTGSLSPSFRPLSVGFYRPVRLIVTLQCLNRMNRKSGCRVFDHFLCLWLLTWPKSKLVGERLNAWPLQVSLCAPSLHRSASDLLVELSRVKPCVQVRCLTEIFISYYIYIYIFIYIQLFQMLPCSNKAFFQLMHILFHVTKVNYSGKKFLQIIQMFFTFRKKGNTF